MKFTAKLLALTICVLQFYETAAQVELGFDRADAVIRESGDGGLYLQTYVGTPSDDVVLRLIPLTVSGFQDYRNANPDRTFAQSTLDDIAAIADPAEYESDGPRDFNNTEFLVVFEASADVLEVIFHDDDAFIFDDYINEARLEGFVLVLEIEQSNPADMVTLTNNRAALVYSIADDDYISLVFSLGSSSLTIPESVGVLSNVFIIEKLNNQESEVNITIIVNVTQGSSNAISSAARDEDFRPVSGGQYSYEIQFTPDQQNVSAAPIEIVNDISAEENETFILSLTQGPDAALLYYGIPPNRNTATILIIDDDSASIGFDVTEYSITEGTNSTVEVCFSLLQGSFVSSSASLKVNITATATSTATLMEDYKLPANPHQVTLNSAQTSACFDVTIIDDDNIEPRECATLSAVVSSSNINYSVIGKETRICVMDDDDDVYRLPGREIAEREGCYPEDTMQARYEISADVHKILREEGRFGSENGSGSGSGSTGTPA